MQSFPHHYTVEARGTSVGPVSVATAGVETLSTAPPAEFDGPGDRWSPETLLVAALVDCFVLTFRAIARASSFEWVDLRCEAEGELDRIEGSTRFTSIAVRAFLTVPEGSDEEKALRMLDKAERNCLITNSLACPVHLEPRVATHAEGRAGVA